MKILNMCIVSALLMCATFMSCSNDDNTKIVNPSPREQWSATLKGNGEILGAYPDLFVNYWEYTYNVNEHPDVALCIKGSYPHARFFSFSIYNDEKGDAIAGIDDVNIEPDANCVNPFKKTSTDNNTFTVYVVPSTMSESKIAQLPSKNICRIEAGVNRAALCIREYLGTDINGNPDEYGGVELPSVQAININTLQEVKAPMRTTSNIDKFSGDYKPQKADKYRDMPFFLASKGAYYPNYSTDYLYARTVLEDDSVLIFSFIPVDVPKKVEDNEKVNARYWSICLGSALNTRSYYSIYDKEADVKDGEKCTFIIAMAQNPNIDKIRAKVDALKTKSQNWQLMVWDREKKDLNDKEIGNTIVTMYRNILPNDKWEHSIAKMKETPYGDPVDHVSDPNMQLAHKALGDYGPYGFKYKSEDFLKDDFKLIEY